MNPDLTIIYLEAVPPSKGCKLFGYCDFSTGMQWYTDMLQKICRCVAGDWSTALKTAENVTLLVEEEGQQFITTDS